MDGCITTILAYWNIFCSSLHCRHAAIWFLALTHFPKSWVTSLDETSLFFFFQRVHLCNKTDKHHPILNVCVSGSLLLLIAHSAATWTVQLRPNFSIYKHKRKLTPCLCLSSATLTQALSPVTHSEAEGDRCRWSFLEVSLCCAPPIAFCLCWL